MDYNDPRTTMAIDDLRHDELRGDRLCRALLRSASPPRPWAGFPCAKRCGCQDLGGRPRADAVTLDPQVSFDGQSPPLAGGL